MSPAALPDAASAFPRTLPTEPFDNGCHLTLSGQRFLVDRTRHIAAREWISINGPAPTEGIAGFVPSVVSVGLYLLHAAATQMATSRAGQVKPLPRVRIRWDGVNLSKVFEPALFDWTTDELQPSLEVKPQFKFLDVERAGKSNPDPWPLRSAYKTKTESALAASATVVSFPSAMGSAAHVPACTINLMMRPRLAAMDAAAPGFSRILELLRQPRALTIGLYDRALHVETDGTHGAAEGEMRAAVERAARCALSLERRFGGGFDRAVWFVASPSRFFKEELRRRFDGGALANWTHAEEREGEGEREGGGRQGRRGMSSRSVAFLRTAGRHTAADLRAANAPRVEGSAAGRHAAAGRLEGEDTSAGGPMETAVFEAFADWWLLGEPSLAVLSGVGSFGQVM